MHMSEQVCSLKFMFFLVLIGFSIYKMFEIICGFTQLKSVSYYLIAFSKYRILSLNTKHNNI